MSAAGEDPWDPARASISEAARLAILDGYAILDTPAEQGFEDVVALASEICAAPIALVSFVARDRQWFKARIGLDATETPRSQSICANALQAPGLLIIPDLTADPRTCDNTLVTGDPHIRFYAGARLETPGGAVLGTLCVIDLEARTRGLTPSQARALTALAGQVMAMLELRRALGEQDRLLYERTRMEERQRFLLEFSDQLRAQATPRGRMQAAVDALGRHLRVTRAGYALVDPGGEMVVPDTEYAHGLPRQPGPFRLDAFGQGLIAMLQSGETVVHSDAGAHAGAGLAARGTGAFLAVPLRRSGRLRAIVYASHDTARPWTPDDVALVEDVATRIWDAVERVRAEDALRHLNATLEAQVAERTRERDRIWQVSEDMLGVATMDGVWVSINPAWARLLGWTGDDIVGRSSGWLEHPGDHGRMQAEFANLALTHQPQAFENRLRDKNGEHRILSWTAVPAEGLVYCVARDVTLDRARAMALRDSMDFTRLALSAVSGVGGWTFDVPTDRFSCDAAICALYGLPPDGVDGMPRSAFLANVHPEDMPKLQAVMAEGLTRSGDLELEYRIRHPDGSTRWVLSRGHTHFDELGCPVRRTGVAVETTRQHHLEEQLRQSQKMEAVGQLTGGVAHDFNNLLMVIQSAAELLARPDLPDARRLRYLAAITDTTARAAKLTSQLLAFARQQTLKPAAFDAGRSIGAMTDMLGTLAGGRIRIVTDARGDCCILADPSQFDTAVVNLAVNARDAMTGQGVLTITLRPVTSIAPHRRHPARPGDFVAVSIADTGCGIAPGDLDRIFEPFFTTKSPGQGTGLGLSQVFGFTKQSNGEVQVESTPGQGTVFTLYLPRARMPDLVAGDPAVPAALVRGNGACVLIVEDNGDVGTLTRETLTELGYRTVWAADAQIALMELAKDAERFDVVLSDMMMPGMNGIELGREVKRRHPGLPIVLASGYSPVLVQQGTNGFDLLQKPYSLDDLSRVLSKAASSRLLPTTGA